MHGFKLGLNKSFGLIAAMVGLSVASPVDAAVVVNTGGPYTFTTDASGSSNPFAVDASASFSTLDQPLIFAWDFNGDGIYNDAFTALATVPFGTFTGATAGLTGNLCVQVSDSSSRGTSCTTATSLGVNSAVPEPATWAMMLLGFAGIGAAMRRRRRGAALHAMGSFQ